MLKDYEIYFNENGITHEEDKNAILRFVRELFAIAIDSINDGEETMEA